MHNRATFCLIVLLSCIVIIGSSTDVGTIDHPYPVLNIASYDYPIQITMTVSSSIDTPQVKIGVENMDGDMNLDDILQTDGTQIILAAPQKPNSSSSNTSAGTQLHINLFLIIAAALISSFSKSNSFKFVSIVVIGFIAIVNGQINTNSPYYTVEVKVAAGNKFDVITVTGKGTFDSDIDLETNTLSIDFCDDPNSIVRIKNLLVNNKLNVCASKIVYELITSKELSGQLESPFDSGIIDFTAAEEFDGKITAHYTNMESSNKRCSVNTSTSTDYAITCGTSTSDILIRADNVLLTVLASTAASTATPTVTKTVTKTRTATPSSTSTASLNSPPSTTSTKTVSPTKSLSSTATGTITKTPSSTTTASLDSPPSTTSTKSLSSTSTASLNSPPSTTSTKTVSPTSTATGATTPTGTSTASLNSPPSTTSTKTVSPTSTGTNTASGTSTASLNSPPSTTSTKTVSPTSTGTNTASGTSTAAGANVGTSTATSSVSANSPPSTTSTKSLSSTTTVTKTPSSTTTASLNSPPSTTSTKTESPTSTASQNSAPSTTSTNTATSTDTSASGTSTGTASTTSTKTISSTGTPSTTSTKTITSTGTSSTTSTKTISSTGTSSTTSTKTISATGTSSTTSTKTITATSTNTASLNSPPSTTSTETGTPSTTSTKTITSTGTPSTTSTMTITSTGTASTTSTKTISSTGTPSTTSTQTISATGTPSTTSTKTLTATGTPSTTSTKTISATGTSSTTSTKTISSTGTPSTTSTKTISATGTASTTSTKTISSTGTPSTTSTKTISATGTSSTTSTKTISATGTPSTTSTKTISSTGTPSTTSTKTISATGTPSTTSTKTLTATATASTTSTKTISATGTPSTTSTKTLTATATASTTKTRTATTTPSRSREGSPAEPCTPGWSEPAAIDQVPSSGPVTDSWTNPGDSWDLSDSDDWFTNGWNNYASLVSIGSNGTDTVYFRDFQWASGRFWLVLKDNMIPSIVRNTEYTLSFKFWQDAANTFSGVNLATGAYRIQLVVVNNIMEDQLWTWLDSAQNGDCSHGYADCYTMFNGNISTTAIAPTSKANALPLSITFTSSTSDIAQILLYVAMPGQTSKAGGNFYYFTDLLLERADRARSFGQRITTSSVYVDVPLQPIVAAPTQSACPHKQQGLSNWHDASIWPGSVVPIANGAAITIPTGLSVLISSCSLDPNGVYGTITIPQGSKLIFNDAAISMKVQNILVNGELWIGSETCRLYSNIQITLVEGAALSEPSGKKGITTGSTGIINMHGKLFQPTWTRIAASAEILDDRVTLQSNVNWEVGQQIVITTSIWEDHLNPQNEVVTITAVQGNKVSFTPRLANFHYAGEEYQAEVALLSRRILIQGDAASETNKFGGHILARGPEAKFSGVQGYRMGQMNVMAKYPFHFHMMNESPNSFFQDCSVYHSFYRCYTIHGTNSTRVSRNVAYDNMGHCYYLEDGVEEKTLFEYNFASFMKPIKVFDFTTGGGSQSGITIYQSDDLTIPADAAPSGFYISNANNKWIGNVASGGFAGFSFINFPSPIGNHRTSSMIPQNRPLMQFYGNTAHSSSYYWNQAGCIYVGGLQKYEADDKLSYNVGRIARDTKDDAGQPSWMRFNHTRVYMCNRGLNHWGERIEAVNYEAHDVTKGITMFGEAWLSDALIEGRSNNPLLTNFPNQRGFEYYDTYVKTILTNIVFKNLQQAPGAVNTGSGTYAIVSMTHSDKFKPQGINAAKNIQYVNVWDGGELGNTIRTTGASRYYNIIDHDGSILKYPFGQGVPTIIGSANEEFYDATNTSVIKDWWRLNSECQKKDKYVLWACRKQTTQEIVSIQLDIDEFTNNVDPWPNPASWAELPSGLNVGTVSQFGYTGENRRSTIVTKNPGITGINGDNGWYFYLDQGSPSTFFIRCMEIPWVNGSPTHIIFAIKYPNAAVLDITTQHLYKNPLNNVPVTPATTFAEMYNDVNGLKYFTKDAGNNQKWVFMKVIDRHYYNEPEGAGYFTRGGVKLYDVTVFYWYKIVVTSCPSCSSTSGAGGLTYYPVTDTVPPFVTTLLG